MVWEEAGKLASWWNIYGAEAAGILYLKIKVFRVTLEHCAGPDPFTLILNFMLNKSTKISPGQGPKMHFLSDILVLVLCVAQQYPTSIFKKILFNNLLTLS